jgi:hypothetical protein
VVAFGRLTVAQEGISPELRRLLNAVQAQLDRDPVVIADLHIALRELLTFLASESGRTNANCHATGGFFMGPEQEWDYEYLPEPFGGILEDVATILHDTVSAPEVALNFRATPEQLLERLEEPMGPPTHRTSAST